MEEKASLGMEYLRKLVDWAIVDGSLVIVTVIVALLGLRLADILSSKLFGLVQKTKEDVDFQKRADTLSAVVRWILRTTIYGVAGMMVLKRFGFDIGPIIAAAGVLGVAVGFGARSLVEDAISGFFILFEDQIRVGDVVQLNDRGGLVERVTLRMVILRDYAGNVHYVRNGSIGVVTNMTKDFSRYVFDIGVAYREDVDEVIRVIKQLDEELRKDPEFMNDIISPLEVAGLDKFGDSAIIIKARITTKPIQQWRIGREFNRRIKKRFDELGIEIPFPHLTVYAGADKDGGAPSFRLASPGDPGAGLTGPSPGK
jgi:moderate conductance mechanosensitive channel